MPTGKRTVPTRSQQIEIKEIIVLFLPLVVLGALLVVVLLNNHPASSKPALTTSPANVTSATATPSVLALVPTATGPASPAPTVTPPPTALSTAPPGGFSASPPAGLTASTTTVVSRTVKPGTPAGNGIRLTKTEGGIKFDLLVSPGRIGDNTYSLLLSENGNQAVTGVSLVRLSVTSLDMDMGVATLDLQPAGADQPGLYSGLDNKLQMLSMFGKYNVAVLVRRPGHDDLTTSFQLMVTGS